MPETGPARRSQRTQALNAHQDAVDRVDDLERLLAEARRDRDDAWQRFVAAGGTIENAADARLPGNPSTCNNCGGDIEYDSDNAPPWTHADSGYSDCPIDGGEEPSGFHAEPIT